MCKWVPGARNINVYVIHPAWTKVRRQLLYENYRSYRDYWPQAELRELDEHETREYEKAKENDKKKHCYLEWKENCEDSSDVRNVANVEGVNNLGVDNVLGVEILGGDGI
ncbi:hypothetical protein LIER_03793 [Lithospermum erythrorhizon]|uniref:Uncharacterized protein n=1 Tax=Lithospermum erythrorhizon TaxID=34254 RepID=A0AAV3NX51_LITER